MSEFLDLTLLARKGFDGFLRLLFFEMGVFYFSSQHKKLEFVNKVMALPLIELKNNEIQIRSSIRYAIVKREISLVI